VDLFTGSVQWSYPIAIPGGRNNLAPPLALSYNSGMVDNLSGYANPQPDGVAMGWSLGTNYIARKIDPETDGVPKYLEEYTLVLNGVSSKLISLDDTQHYYALENERYWKIERIELTGDVDDRGNRGGDYWLVTLPDGIQYRFGYQDETAGANSTESAWWMVTPGKDDPSLRLTNWRWNLDLISDRRENFVRLDYARETNDFIYGENIYDHDLTNNIAHIFSQNPWCEKRYECGACVIDGIPYKACYDYMSDRENRSGYARGGYLEQITYSWPGATYKVVFNTEIRDDYEERFDSQDPSYPRQLWQTFWSKQRLSSIDVYSVDQGQLVRRYELATSKINNILVLDSIQEVAADGSRMPPTSFNYYYRAGYCNQIKSDGSCYDATHELGHKYWLKRIFNGYGGSTHFEYTAPENWESLWEWQNGQTMNPHPDTEDRYWFRYRVREVKTDLGIANVMRTAYEYRKLDEAPAAGEWKLIDNRGDDNPKNDIYEFRGHPLVRVKQRDGSGAVVAYTDHYFYQGNGGPESTACGVTLPDRDGMEGREYLTVQKPADNSRELYHSETAYLYRDLDGGQRFVTPQATCSYPEGYSVADPPGSFTSSNYTYDNHGNVTREVHEGAANLVGDEYVIEREYLPNEDRWIINTPQTETLKAMNGAPLRQTIYAYDNQAEGVAPSEGKVTQVRQGLNDLWATMQTWYNPSWGYPEIVTDALKHATRTDYDNNTHQFPVTVTNAKGQTATTQWDLRLGVPTVFTDANGAAAHITYDSFGRPIAVTPPGDNAPSVKYTYPVPPSSPITASIQAPFAVKTETRIDAYLPTPQYQSSWAIYDGLGRVIQTQSQAENGQLVLSDTAYDNLGRPVMASVPYTVSAPGGVYIAPDWNALRKTVTAYDVKGRIIAVTAPDGSVTQKAYQPWRELLLDANGHQTAYINDGLGRLIEVHEYDGTYVTPTWNTGNPAVTKYIHDAAGNLIRVVDALGHVTTMAYDALGRKTAMDDPSMGKWNYVYNLAGNLIRQTDAEGQTLVFEYDELDRLIRKSVVSGSANQRVSASASNALLPAPYSLLHTSYSLLAAYAYDQGLNGIGRRTAMTDTSGTAFWQYDAQGRAIRETRTVAGAGTFVSTQGYDAAGRVITTALPTGEVIHNTYNLRGLPETVTGLDGYLTAAVYNALGQPLRQTWGNGRQTVYGYDLATQRLESLQVGTLLDLSYTYDRVGNLRTLADAGNGGQVQTFAYDARDRLTSAQSNDAGQGQYREAYGYDKMGNIITRTYGSKTITYTYGRKYGLQLPGATTPVTHTDAPYTLYFPIILREEAFQQPFAVVATSVGFRAGYDRNGNMLVRVELSGTEIITYTQEWNAENRLAVVTNTGTGDVTRFVYDGDGSRVAREDPSGLTVNVGAIEVSISGTQRLTTTYYFVGGQRIAMRKDGAVTYLHGDHLGSASLATDASGAKVSEMRYTPFGETRRIADDALGDAPTDRRFTGQRQEVGIGLYDYGARFYSTGLGRFLSADITTSGLENPQSLNRYAYTLNNPLNYTDPNGKQPIPPSTVSGSPLSLLYQSYRIVKMLKVAGYREMGRVPAAGISLGVGKLEDNLGWSGPSDLNKNLHGSDLVRKYRSLIIDVSTSMNHELITPALLAAIVRTQGGPNAPLLGWPERLQSVYGLCSGTCSLGITQMDVGNAMYLQQLGLMPALGDEAQTAQLLISNPEANLRYMATMLAYGDQLLVNFWQANNMGMPPDQVRLELMAMLQNGSIASWERTVMGFSSWGDWSRFYKEMLSLDPNIPKVLPWQEWAQGILDQGD